MEFKFYVNVGTNSSLSPEAQKKLAPGTRVVAKIDISSNFPENPNAFFEKRGNEPSFETIFSWVQQLQKEIGPAENKLGSLNRTIRNSPEISKAGIVEIPLSLEAYTKMLHIMLEETKNRVVEAQQNAQ